MLFDAKVGVRPQRLDEQLPLLLLYAMRPGM
jgi:hypothetical protein